MVWLSVTIIEIYQRYLSFDTGILRVFAPNGACRYEVRCSEYTKRMIIAHGFLKGWLMGVGRIISCR